MFRLLAPALAALLLLPATALAAPRPAKQLYVSLGDSYASGYQPTGVHEGSNTRHGFAYQVPRAARRRGHRLELVNFGCGGATTTSILERIGCPPDALGPGGIAYPKTTQARAAVRYIRAHRADMGLITVSSGGNAVTACARAADPISCVGAAVGAIKKNVTKLVGRLRRAAGPDVPIVGITYPDVILGGWVSGDPAAQNLAKLSVVAFQSLINPALKDAYATAGASVVDVTAATGAYGSLDATTTLAPYGTVPVPVAKVCELTFYCQYGDIHARTAGYRIIAGMVAAELPKARRRS
jgi:lysophospholipase L1-like esterase